MADNNALPNAPIKEYEIVNLGTLTTRKLAVQQNGQPILLINRKQGFFERPQVNIQLQDKTIVAACKSRSFGGNQRLFLGNPDCADKAAWNDLVRESFGLSKYKFMCNGRSFGWTRTHNKELGASRWGSMDYKLIDDQTGQILAVYLNNSKMFSTNPVARIDYYVELGQDLELLSLAAIAGIEEAIRRSKRSSAAAGGGGGGA